MDKVRLISGGENHSYWIELQEWNNRLQKWMPIYRASQTSPIIIVPDERPAEERIWGTK